MSYSQKEMKDWCLNCGAELPYTPEEWPPNFPKVCPKCRVRLDDPKKMGSMKIIKE